LNESLSREFSKQGIENGIYSFSLQYPSFLFPGTTQKETSTLGSEDIVIHETINSINPFSWLKTALLIAKEKPDFLVVRFWLPFMAPALGTIIRWVKKRLEVKVIGLLDNVIPHEKRVGDRPFTQYFINQCDSFVVMSSSVLQDLKQFDDQKPSKLLYHPVYDHFGSSVEKGLARKHLALSDNDKVILFFGIIRKYKGLKLLLEAVSRMRNLENVRLVVAGEFYEEKSSYLKCIEELGLQDNVVIHSGFVDQNKVKFYFSAADIVAQPYLSATQSGVTQIAYHFGTPMLVTDVGGLAEMVPDKKVGYVCKVDSGSIASSLDDFFDQNRGAEFQSGINIEKERFGWRHFAKEVALLAE